jgi:CheY-like chemotaxis protein
MSNELILIVEDNEKNRRLVRDVLQHAGFRTIESDSGEQGLRLAREHLPALILMDIQLTGMNGIETLRALRAQAETRGIPVVAVTASVMTHDRQHILAAGFDGYQPKPIHIRALLDQVRSLIGGGAPSGESR